MAAAQTGKRYVCTSCGAEFIVTRGGEAELKCGGNALEQKKLTSAPTSQPASPAQEAARWQCNSVSDIRTRRPALRCSASSRGECELKADDREMELMQPKVLPSAD